MGCHDPVKNPKTDTAGKPCPYRDTVSSCERYQAGVKKVGRLHHTGVCIQVSQAIVLCPVSASQGWTIAGIVIGCLFGAPLGCFLVGLSTLSHHPCLRGRPL
jgi:hypothetical protein